MDTETVLTPAAYQFPQEYHLVVDLFYRNVIIDNAFICTLHFVQLVIMGSEQRFGSGFGVLVYMLDNSPRDRYTVVSTRSPPQLVEQNQTPLRQIVENIGGLGHLDHKGRFAERDIVRCPHTSENLVHNPYLSGLGRNETSYLSHQNNQSGLAQQRRFTGHVGSRYHHDLLLVVVELDTVADVGFARRQLFLDNRVTSFLDVDNQRIVYFGTNIPVFHGRLHERQQAVEPRNEIGIELYGRNILRQCKNQIIEQLRFQ